jgi:LemA protein
MTTLIVVLVVLVGLVLWAVSQYNGLVRLRNAVKNAFSQIDVQLKRRYDLIPNLVETAKGYMKHERETLDAVINARNRAITAEQKAASGPTQPGAIKELQQAEGQLQGAMTRFFALAEAYPDLKANQNMAMLQEELTSTENKVAFARQAYNDAVMGYNTARESFPAVLVAGPLGFQAADLFQLDSEAERAAPKVSFA